MKILAISGSLRSQSTNTVILREALKLAPANVETVLFEGLADLPHFNPDLDTDTPPKAVQEFRDLLKSSQALLVCSPEYIHGIPGSLKNAFDWIASSGELDGMPVGIINATPSMDGAGYAHEALKEVLKVLSNRLVPEAILIVSAVKTKIQNGQIVDSQLKNTLSEALKALTDATQQSK